MIAFIRTATIEDIPQLLELENKSFNDGDKFSRNQFYYAIQKGESFLRVYEEEKGISGYVYILVTGRIYSIAAYPNRGIGSLLLTRAEEFVKIILNKNTIKLEVRKDNTKAINFYIKRGYNPDKIKYHYYQDGMDALVMKKELNSYATRRLAATSDIIR